MKRYVCEPDDAAFPGECDSGLTKREWFAGQVMTHLINRVDGLKFAAELSVKAVDALIEALNKQ